MHEKDKKGCVPAMSTETKEVIPAPPNPAMARPRTTCQKVWPAPLDSSQCITFINILKMKV